MKQQKTTGVVKTWDVSRGFGFIEVGEYPETNDYFAHISSCQEDYEPL
jgi:cold shock CspA family protein